MDHQTSDTTIDTDQIDFLQLIDRSAEKQSQASQQVKSREEDLSRQVRNLLLLYPITRLENEKLRLGPEHQTIFKGIDTIYLSFALFDYISECMVFEAGSRRKDIVQFLCFELVKISPHLPEEDQKIAAEIVLDQLCNSRDNHKSFSFDYYDASSGLTRSREFRLILYKIGADGEGRYILTKEGFAALLSMLELDSNMKLEVNEYIIRKLVDRGNFTEALRIAKQNRTLTIEYRDLLNRKLFQINRDIGNMSWQNDIKPYLEKSRHHIQERIREEGQMMERFISIMETAEPRVRRKLNSLLDVIGECQNRHRELHTNIMNFNAKFLTAQNKAFRTPKDTPLAHLETEILHEMGTWPIARLIKNSDEITAQMNAPVIDKVFDPVMLLSFIDKIDAEELEKERTAEEPEAEMIDLQTIPDRFDDSMIRQMTRFLELQMAEKRKTDMVSIMKHAEEEGFNSDEILCLVYLVYQMYGDKNTSGQYDIRPSEKIDRSASPFQLISGDNLVLEKK